MLVLLNPGRCSTWPNVKLPPDFIYSITHTYTPSRFQVSTNFVDPLKCCSNVENQMKFFDRSFIKFYNKNFKSLIEIDGLLIIIHVSLPFIIFIWLSFHYLRVF